ncbi:MULTISPECIES: hypothetical protein [unclassified Maridesulfovibrio]|uniref:hypothetical protein n=1 Tax=unclassified Maridesulfovibrio TaxID=2794999 RepID=UPI003B41A941
MRESSVGALRSVFGGYFSTLTFGLDLVAKYGVYPYELFNIPTSEQIVDALNSDEGLPKRSLFSNLVPTGKAKSMTVVKAVSTRLETIKHEFYQHENGKKANYHDLNEYRIVGMWFWDNLYFPKIAYQSGDWDKLAKDFSKNEQKADDNFMRLLKKLPQEEWYLKLEISKVDRSVLGENVCWEDKKDVVGRYRNHYKLAKKCIEHGKVLPLNSAR